MERQFYGLCGLILFVSLIVQGCAAGGTAPAGPDVEPSPVVEPDPLPNPLPTMEPDVQCPADSCTEGMTICIGTDRVFTCNRTNTGCPGFEPTQTCEGGMECIGGACQEPNSCQDPDGDGYGPNCAAGPDCDNNDADRFVGNPEICDDFFDNDRDGLVDCDDVDCIQNATCALEQNREICGDGTDNDGDGVLDCDDPDCQGNAFCEANTGCQAEQCISPPPSFCDGDGDVLVVFDPVGDCKNDACFYEPIRLPCSNQNRVCRNAQCAEPDPETCDDGIDNNGDNLVDCNDPLCERHMACLQEMDACVLENIVCNEPPTPFCRNETLVLFGEGDCKEGMCFYTELPVECTNQQQICRNAACVSPTQEICNDNLDNDFDGQIDCNDTDCSNDPVCLPPVEICGDNLDNDSDGQIDCSDTDCVGDPSCAPGPCEGIVCNTPPNDFCESNVAVNHESMGVCTEGECRYPNSVTNCAAQNMVCGSGQCVPPPDEICDDGADNDRDSSVDCDDTDCAAAPNCQTPPENCTDNIDNDVDGQVDCDDTDCTADPACQQPDPELCNDNIDNDGNGQIDCDDTACAEDEACATAEMCWDADIGNNIGMRVLEGSNTANGNNFSGANCTTFGARGEDVAVTWTAPSTGCFALDLAGSDYDTVLWVLDSCQEQNQLACNDDSEMFTLVSALTLNATADTSYIIVIDGWNTLSLGSFVLNINPCP